MTDIKLNLNELLQSNRLIAHIWNTEDVLIIRPDLTDDQAWAVLQHVAAELDSTIGIEWNVIEQACLDLFGHNDPEA